MVTIDFLVSKRFTSISRMCSPSDVLGEINPYENHEEGVKLNKRPKSAPSRLLRIGSSSLTDSNEVTSPSQAHLRENSVGPSEAGLHINNSSSGNGNNATGVSTIENACCKPRPIFQTYFDIEFVFCQSPFSIGFELPFQFQLLQNVRSTVSKFQWLKIFKFNGFNMYRDYAKAMLLLSMKLLQSYLDEQAMTVIIVFVSGNVLDSGCSRVF